MTMPTASASATALLTAAELLAMPDDGYRYELAQGVLTEKMPPPGKEHGVVSTRFATALSNYSDANDYGTVGDNHGYRLESNPDTVRAPDVAWFAPGHPAEAVSGYPEHAPDLAVEVKSPNDSIAELAERAAMWLHYGSREVWVAVPAPTISVTRHRPGQPPLRYTRTTYWTAATCCPASVSRCGACSAAIARPR